MFLENIDKTARLIKPLLRNKKIKLLTQFDTDGLTAASIIIKMLIREDINFELKVFKQLTSSVIEEIKSNENEFLILTDFGSGQLLLLKEIIEKENVLILDHHEPVDFKHPNLFHINPILFDEDELSSSIVCYLFAKAVNSKNSDLIDLAIIGAIGDSVDEKWEFKGFAKNLFEDAESFGKLSVTKGLRFYGRNSRPIYQSLSYSFDPFIPGISGSESHAVQFLSELGISLKNGDEWKKLKDLTVDEQKKLASEIIRERMCINECAEDIFGDVYTVMGRPEELQDVREFSTLINSCGRMNNASIGIRLCLGDYSILETSSNISNQYRKTISDILNLIRENKISIHKTKSAGYINGGDKIPDTIIGTITSIVLNSNLVDAKPLFGFSNSDNGVVKMSARLPRNQEVNLREVIIKAASQIDSKIEAGGHMSAAGAFIPKGKQEDFIKIVDNILEDINGSKKV